MKYTYIRTLAICSLVSTLSLTNAFALFGNRARSVDDFRSDMKLSFDFENNKIFDSIKGREYFSDRTSSSYKDTSKGKGINLNGGAIRIPNSDLGINSNTEKVTVSFLYNYKNTVPDELRFLISFGSYSFVLFDNDSAVGNVTGFGFNTANGDYYGVEKALEDGRTYHMTVEFNKSDVTKNKIYIDGDLQTMKPIRDAQSSAQNAQFNGDMTIGALTNQSEDSHYRDNSESTIDEIHVFDRGLSKSEVDRLALLHRVPELSVVEKEGSARLDWATEMLESDIFLRLGFEDTDTKKVRLEWNPNKDGDLKGGQFLTGMDKYSGEKSLYSPSTLDGKGNWYNFPDTTSDENIINFDDVRVPNGSNLSVSFRAKSLGAKSSDIHFAADGKWGSSFLYKQSTYAEDYPAGTQEIKVYSKGDLSIGEYIANGDEPLTYGPSQIRAIKDNLDGTHTLTLSWGFEHPVTKGETIRYRPWRAAADFEEKNVLGGEWKLFNSNTKLPNYNDWDMSKTGFNFISGIYSQTGVHLDDIKLGYATKVKVFRDNSLVYEGFGSEFQDEKATDKEKPNTVTQESVKLTMDRLDVEQGNRLLNISFDEPSDIGSTYNYQIQGSSNTGETPKSSKRSLTITSGIQGYSYVIDKSKTTIPDNSIDTTSTKLSHSPIEFGPHYLHIKAIDKKGNVSDVSHILIDIPKLTAKADPKNNDIDLKWSVEDKDENTVFKVFQKKEGSDVFQSISATDIENGDQVKVLNIHPVRGDIDTFTTWDGETVSLPASAALKRWMEEPNIESPKGYGKGLIDVETVSIMDYNKQPDLYLKDSSGEYKYDVIMFGSWDTNDSKDLNQLSVDATKLFLESGRGVLFGHDTLCQPVRPYFYQLKDVANISPISGNYRGESTDSKLSNIVISKEGLLTNYPWFVGLIDTPLSVPLSHNSEDSMGDIWMRYTKPNYTDKDMKSTANNYLSTWNNTAKIQTGHSSGASTPDEQKLLANTLFYLNQLLLRTSLNDKSGQDLVAPDAPVISESWSGSTVTVNSGSTKDNGSDYEYYVEGKSKDTQKLLYSNIESVNITSGVKGFSYVIDDKPATNPDNIIESDKLSVTISTEEKPMYLHIKTIDNAGNSSEVKHIRYSNDGKPKAPVINPSRLDWGKDDASFTITQPHNKNLTAVIIDYPDENSSTVAKTLVNMGYKVDYRKGLTDVSEIEKYDVVIVDAYVWDVLNGSFVETLYNSGMKIITSGNDTDTLLPIKETYLEDYNFDQTYEPSIINEATFFAKQVYPYSDVMYPIIAHHPDAEVWHKNKQNKAISNTLYMKNSIGGEWIHFQHIFTHSDEENEIVMGSMDYITDHITPKHLTDIQYRIDGGEWVSYRGETVPVSKNGITSIEARNIDTDGNVSNPSTAQIKIDRTAPSVKLVEDTTNWINTDATLTLKATDTKSGVSKIEYSLDGATTKGWTIYNDSLVVSGEGITTIKAKVTDNAGNVIETVVGTVKIDKTNPESVVSLPQSTLDENIVLSFTNIVDIHSGAKGISISESNDFITNTTNVDVLNKSNIDVPYTLSKKASSALHYGDRDIHVKITDVAGNIKKYKFVITLKSNAPQKPIIKTPTNNQLFSDKERIRVEWIYSNSAREFSDVKQSKADIMLEQVGTGEIFTFNVAGEGCEATLDIVPIGEYNLTVKVYNTGGASSVSDSVRVRVGTHLSEGTLATKDIAPGNTLSYIKVISDYLLPKNTSITGYVYFAESISEQFDESNKISFALSSEFDRAILKLPIKSAKVKVVYTLNNNTNPVNSKVTPALEHIRVFAK